LSFEIIVSLARLNDAPPFADPIVAKLEQLREAVFTCHIVCGWPRTIDALSAFRDAIGAELAARLAGHVPLSRASSSDATVAQWFERGVRRFELVYGEKTNTVRAVLRRGAPSQEQLVLASSYGAVMSDDDVLSLEQRELTLLAALRVGDAMAQFASHAAAVQRLYSVTERQLDALQQTAIAALRALVARQQAKLAAL
jgi:alkylhydroperoxidase/carboxymuconolactone decarboxylase family protein YurZ